MNAGGGCNCIMSHKVFKISPLPQDADLASHFNKYEPYDAHVKTSMTGRSRGFAVLRFSDPEMGQKVITFVLPSVTLVLFDKVVHSPYYHQRAVHYTQQRIITCCPLWTQHKTNSAHFCRLLMR